MQWNVFSDSTNFPQLEVFRGPQTELWRIGFDPDLDLRNQVAPLDKFDRLDLVNFPNSHQVHGERERVLKTTTTE